MANTIKHKRGTSTPEASDLVAGELAINTNNGDVFTKTDGNAVVQVGRDVVDDTSPQLGGDLDMNSKFISSGILGVKNTGAQSEVRWYCESNNAHYVALRAPAHSAFSGNITLTLPPTTGSAHQVLKTDGSGNLDWVAQTTAYTNSNVDTHLGVSGASSGYVLSWNGSAYAWVAQSTGGGSTSPGGSNTQVQFNNSGNFGGSSNLTFDGTDLTCGGKVNAGASAASGANNLRRITTSTSSPSGGSDGDIWIKYTA